MKELNELVELAEEADAVEGLIDDVNPRTILAIAEAFRVLEQEKIAAEHERDCHMDIAEHFKERCRELERRAEAAEVKLAELERQEPVAWRYRTTNIHGEPNQGWTFADSDSLMGLYQPLYTKPAPAVSLAELSVIVPDKLKIKARSHQSHVDYAEGWSDCIDEVKRLNEVKL